MILTGVRALPGEEWRPVVGYEGKYLVSNLGRVYSIPRRGVAGGLLAQVTTGRPGAKYLTVLLYSTDGRTHRKVHRLVTTAFHGPPSDPNLVTRHLNGDPGDNRASNLAWGTQAENWQDMIAHGRCAALNKTRCPAGHPYDESNTYVNPHRGSRTCRICQREHNRKHRAKIRTAA